MAGLLPPTPYQWQVNDIASGALLNAQLYDGLTFLLNPPMAQLYASATQNLGSSSSTTLNLDTVITDPYGGFNAAAHGWVAPFSAWWDVRCKWHATANATGNRATWPAVNGTTVTDGEVWQQAGSSTVTVATETYVFVQAGQTVTAVGWQSSGATLATTSAASAFASMNIKFASL